MRVAVIGVSHWHVRRYCPALARLAGIHIAAVSDPNPTVAETMGRDLGAKAFTDYRDLIGEVRPDFVFAFGRHCDMAGIASTLIDESVPFVVEKPGGLNFGQVSAIRDRASAKGAYAGTGFNFRVSDLVKKIQAVIDENPVTHASFRYIAGGPYRYHELGCAWMLDPKLSGGGSTINLSVHFIDMFRLLSQSKATEVTSLMGHHTWELSVEDYSSMILRSPRSVCTIETGYTYPAPGGVFDLRFSIRTTRHYLVARSDNVLEIHRTCDGHVEQFSTQMSNAYWYPVYVTETLDRFARGLPPVADLNDLADAMEVVDAAYASNRASGAVIRLGNP